MSDILTAPCIDCIHNKVCVEAYKLTIDTSFIKTDHPEFYDISILCKNFVKTQPNVKVLGK